MSKKDTKIKFRQDLIYGVDLECLVNRVLDWSYDIYDKLFHGKKTELIQGRHLASFSILTNIGRMLHESHIELDLAEPSMNTSVTLREKAVIRQEFVSAKDFADMINTLLELMAKKTADADRIAGKWLPDEFTMGELQSFKEFIDIAESVFLERGLVPNDLHRRFNDLVLSS